jgi:hypothetical protein
VAENRRLEHRVRQRTHVQRDELTTAAALLVQRTRYKLLPTSRLSLNEYGETAFGDALDPRTELPHG